MQGISFQIIGKELILCYTPSFEAENLLEDLLAGKSRSIKHTFWVTQEFLRDFKEDSLDFVETLYFCIGQIGNTYTLLDSNIIKTKHSFYFGNEIELRGEMFIASRNISILKKIDELIERDFYVGGNWENSNGISKSTFMELIKKFPKTTELDKYVHYRIANVLKEYYFECDKYEEIYNKYMENKRKPYVQKENRDISKYNLRIELEQFTVAHQELKKMLEEYEAIDEKQWQSEIYNILQLMYPQYIYCAREIRFHGIGKYDKQPDFLLVDVNGFVDILEIKKADILLLTKYRNNYVASRELSGAIQQIEKYIYSLNSSDKARSDVSSKLFSRVPAGVEIHVINPQGILLLGRSNEFTKQQLQDFELIKRQYKHITDIITYDDLLARINNIVKALQSKFE